METLRGVIERITFHSEETGYTVAKLLPETRVEPVGYSFRRPNEVTLVGVMAGLQVGECVEAEGRWNLHVDYGRQFQVERLHVVLPATVAGIQRYLGSGLIKGIGPVMAGRIVGRFGTDTLAVIDETPDRLHEVHGIGAKRVRLIVQAWAEQRAIKEVMLFLQSHDVSTSLATKIYKFYGDEAVAVVRSDPYRLARDIYGIGFLTADKIAKSLGMAPDSPERVAAGIAYALSQAVDEGNVFLPASALVRRAGELLDVSPDGAAVGLLRLWREDGVKVAETAGGEELGAILSAGEAQPLIVAEGRALYAATTVEQARRLLAEEPVVYLTPLYYSERGVAGRLLRLLRGGSSRLARFANGQFNWKAALAAAERSAGMTLAPQQRLAVQATLTHRVTVLTGGPGTGKTTTVRTILGLCSAAGYRVLLAAPTGRAAKRLAEATGHPAKTLHRLLEFKPGEGLAFKRNEESPLEGDLLIVDEASMLDLVLANHLLRAVPPGMHLLLVGDVDQLPSVGAGNVLKDIIGAVEELPTDNARVVALQTIFRQAAGSFIIVNAHRIQRGELPILDNEGAVDFFFFRTEEPERAAQLCVELVAERIPKRFHLLPHEIQVLSPMHRGASGVAALNEALQKALNPPRPGQAERRIGSRVYRAGDRVMQVRNNYDKDVYNGDLGTIGRINLDLHEVVVEFDEREVLYDFLELDELAHAYAVSVHKSQGSEFPAVVIPILTSHFMMLQRNLLYTAVTRARRLVVLVGQPRAIALAVRNDKVAERYSGLHERLLRSA